MDFVILLGVPLIYIVIGGGVNAFRFVERSLANGIPVIIAMVNVLKIIYAIYQICQGSKLENRRREWIRSYLLMIE